MTYRCAQVLITTAVTLDISDLLANEKVGAIVHMGVPGIQAIGVGDVSPQFHLQGVD